ncbi:hypothetical protein [Salinivirga cyanobacteriivorans]|uniref:TonB C-terminal domain-containing protein n=1 Tax=Salinivirga cyanobacteriivorans TaxID=1307839 RepID=A0A0S2HZ27_9BACT|nr:hypothetical protein [Salinivirga cyanobacteriivorans]ALO15294.1 hypothetical protein L21SP5_01651 [Salinivirga cyanobacteriivorans]
MKSIRLFSATLILALVFSAGVSKAFPAIKATANTDKELYTAIQQLVQFPDNCKELGHSGSVWVTFFVDGDGWIDVYDVRGDCMFSDYVKQQLPLISVENPELFGKTYQIKISFNFIAQ